MTEILFEGLLNDLEPAEIVAALSAMVYQQKSDDEEFSAEIPPDLLRCCERMKTVARNLGTLQKENGVNIDPEEYIEEAMKFGLVHVTYEWAIGVPFDSICSLTTAKEGSIVRCITRLDELCREVRVSEDFWVLTPLQALYNYDGFDCASASCCGQKYPIFFSIILVSYASHFLPKRRTKLIMPSTADSIP